MLWELRYDRDKYVVDKAIRKRQSLPQWYLEQPKLLMFEDFYLRAFWHLVTEQGRGNTIPHSKILEYAERSGLDSDMMDPFCSIIWVLNDAFRQYTDNEHERQKLVDKPSPAKRAKNQHG